RTYQDPRARRRASRRDICRTAPDTDTRRAALARPCRCRPISTGSARMRPAAPRARAAPEDRRPAPLPARRRARPRARRACGSGPQLRVGRTEIRFELDRERRVVARLAVEASREIIATGHEQPERAFRHAQLRDTALVGHRPVRMGDDLRAADRRAALLVARDDRQHALGRAHDADVEARASLTVADLAGVAVDRRREGFPCVEPFRRGGAELGRGVEQPCRARPRLGADPPRREHAALAIANAEHPRIGHAPLAALDADLHAERPAALDGARHVPDDDASRVGYDVIVTFGVHVATLRFVTSEQGDGSGRSARAAAGGHPTGSWAACVPAMKPCTWPLPRPCLLKPPTASPPAYRPGMT